MEADNTREYEETLVVSSYSRKKSGRKLINENIPRVKCFHDIPADEKVCENAFRPFVLGRKNWLFSGSSSGAKSSCLLCSLIETAKYHGIKIHEYLAQSPYQGKTRIRPKPLDTVDVIR